MADQYDVAVPGDVFADVAKAWPGHAPGKACELNQGKGPRR